MKTDLELLQKEERKKNCLEGPQTRMHGGIIHHGETSCTEFKLGSHPDPRKDLALGSGVTKGFFALTVLFTLYLGHLSLEV
jgi:hypothetical protein